MVVYFFVKFSMSYIEAVALRCSLKKVLKFWNFAKFTGKHLCQGLFLNKVASLRLAALLKKRETLAQMFFCEFCKIFKNTFSYRIPPVAASVSYVLLYFHCTDLTSNPSLGYHDGFSKNLLGFLRFQWKPFRFFKIPLCSNCF